MVKTQKKRNQVAAMEKRRKLIAAIEDYLAQGNYAFLKRATLYSFGFLLMNYLLIFTPLYQLLFNLIPSGLILQLTEFAPRLAEININMYANGSGVLYQKYFIFFYFNIAIFLIAFAFFVVTTKMNRNHDDHTTDFTLNVTICLFAIAIVILYFCFLNDSESIRQSSSRFNAAPSNGTLQFIIDTFMYATIIECSRELFIIFRIHLLRYRAKQQ